MKIKVNRNILWAEVFVKNLLSAGVKYVCISPGSRSTPLTYAFASEPKIKCYVHIDERSAAFFASGLARKSGTPVVLLCTSGTAVAEYYPGVIEAYQQRIPLIVCTADRPTGSYKKGLNQTINQENIYKNHIRWFIDAGLPDPYNLVWIERIARSAVLESIKQRGPVHINFPFSKPFEPDNYTDEIEEMNFSVPDWDDKTYLRNTSEDDIELAGNSFLTEPEGFITVGPGNFSESFKKELFILSSITGYPILADGTSQLRFGNEVENNIVTNYDALFRAGFFSENKPGLILHYGKTMTSKGYEDFIRRNSSKRFLVNAFGDTFDPGDKVTVLEADEEQFTRKLYGYLKVRGLDRSNAPWIRKVLAADIKVCDIKKDFIGNIPFPDESRIIYEILNLLPEESNLMLSNSSPVRDFDYFAGQFAKKIRIYHNRGASGIDGITSTALGIASSGEKTILITGDLAFYHDMNGLLSSAQYNIPLIIILINNNGGGIFSTLPVSGYKEIFRKYFTTPHNISFKYFVEGYGGLYTLISDWNNLTESFNNALMNERLTVLEIRTDANEALTTRKNFWSEVKENLNDNSPG